MKSKSERSQLEDQRFKFAVASMLIVGLGMGALLVIYGLITDKL